MKLDEMTVKEFFEILKKKAIKPVFQPIVSLKNGEILGYEALSRITLEKTEITTDKLFDMAERLGQVWNLEKLCRTKALKAAVDKPRKTKLFLNVDANVILDQEFVCGFTRDFLGKYGLRSKDIVFELTERSFVDDKTVFQRGVNHYKEQGYEIAIDDVGSGYSNLNRISCVEPQYIKIDMELIRNIHMSKTKKSMVRIMEHFCREMGCILIAEGIETKEELKTLIELGVPYGQGYFFQKPAEEFVSIPKKIKNKIIEMQNNGKQTSGETSVFGNIESICKPGSVVRPDVRAIEVYRRFCEQEELTEICVVTESGEFCGILTRDEVLSDFGGMYGYTLHQRYTVSDLMKRDTLVVNADFSVENVAKIAMDRSAKEVYHAVIVLKDGYYHGIVTIKDLLSALIKIQVTKAADANPLTGLPGNMVIESKIKELIGDERAYAVMYLDLDNFKAYNDAYGFNSGDRMIMALAQSMKQVCPEEDFLGHIGGDDFVIITRSDNAQELGKCIVDTFRAGLQQLYRASDWERGYIISKNRSGVTEQFPIASVSIAIVTNGDQRSFREEELSEKIVEAKKAAKQKKGNSIVVVA